MKRLPAIKNKQRLNTAICGALSLAHSQSFKVAAALQRLLNRCQYEFPDYIRWGIHVMISQMESGEFTVGDSINIV